MATNDEALTKLNHLRQRVRSTDTAMTEARVKHEQASADVRAAREHLIELGVTAEDLKDIDVFISREIGAVEVLLRKVETDLDKVQKAADG